MPFAVLQPDRFSGEVDGKVVALYTLRNPNGMVCCITNYGAKITQLLVPDCRGQFDDVVLGYDSLDGVVNQIEGGAIQTVSWVLKEAVQFDRTRILSNTWDSYPILRFSEVPTVEVHVLNRLEEKSLGAGEATHGPVAAAIANAVSDALGVRVRDMPLSKDNITRAALADAN